jgi:endonuclease YncB( thermonuclease family)
MSTPPAVAKFRKLIDDMSRVCENVRRTNVRGGWELGRYLVEAEQDGELRAKYGSRLLQKSSVELTKRYGPGFSVTNLKNMRSFYLQNPNRQVPDELDWTDHVELLPVKDEKLRKRLEQRLIKDDLNSRELRKLVRDARGVEARKSPLPNLPPLKRPVDLKLNTFAKSTLNPKIKNDCVLIDCGFFVSWPATNEELSEVSVTDKPAYTYAATVERVVDGDTLLVLIEAGFGIIVRDKLRLRGVNCPELKTPEGDKAKKFVEKLLPAGARIVLKSHKSGTDKYGRFVVDVFYLQTSGKSEGQADVDIIAGGVWLNQQLLDEGQAVRMAE